MYQKILCALLLKPEIDAPLISRVRDLKSASKSSQIHLLHVVEPIVAVGMSYGVGTSTDLEQDLLNTAREKLAAVAAELEVSTDNQHIELGSAHDGILNEAKTIAADLIVIGTGEKSGIGLLIGSTANGVCHAAECDVLAVRTNNAK